MFKWRFIGLGYVLVFLISFGMYGCTGSGESSSGSGDGSTVSITETTNNNTVDDGGTLIINQLVPEEEGEEGGEETEYTEDDPTCSVDSREAGRC